MNFNRMPVVAFFAVTSVAMTITGCATTGTDGIVQMGPDMYMVGGLGKFTDYSSSGVKARLYQDAAKFCSEKNRVMLPANSTGQDAGYGTYASAEIQFRCVMPDDPRVPK